ncbi:MAG: ABC transporter substrate-binding protein [Acidimicrobiia bacterium]
MTTRRDFLRLAALAGAGAALGGFGCSGGEAGSGADGGTSAGQDTEADPKTQAGEKTLRIALWSHFIPRYDAWWDDEYTRRWGEEHGVNVVVDHIPYAQLGPRAAAEVAAGEGHDLFAFITPPPVFEDDVIDHREIVEEVEAKVGKMAPIMERNVFNPRTGKYFAFGEYWVANPVHYRSDLWDEVAGGAPASWADVLEAAPQLKALGQPVGIAMSPDDDSAFSLHGLMAAYGSHLQDEQGRLALDTPETVEAVKVGAAIYQAGMSEAVFNWDSSSNNRALVTGASSLVLNTISAIRGAEDQDRALAAQVALAPSLSGPAGRLGVNSVVNTFVIWRFARNQEAAKQFLVDLALNAREAFLRSRFYNLPAFPGTVPDLADLVAVDDQVEPPSKYALLAGAEEWSTNIGFPGHDSAATDEVFYQFTVPKMFAAAARGDLSAEEAVKTAAAEAAPVFEKWRERGKI